MFATLQEPYIICKLPHSIDEQKSLQPLITQQAPYVNWHSDAKSVRVVLESLSSVFAIQVVVLQSRMVAGTRHVLTRQNRHGARPWSNNIRMPPGKNCVAIFTNELQ